MPDLGPGSAPLTHAEEDFLAGRTKWREEEGIDVFNKNDAEAVRKKLNSSEYRKLKVNNIIL